MASPANSHSHADRRPIFEIITKVEFHRLEREKGNALASYLIGVADMWPDLRFTAPDGREFAFLCLSESIRQHIQAMGVWLNRVELRALRNTEAAIVDLSSDEPPLTFDDFFEGWVGWDELRTSFTAEAAPDEDTL